ncbi:hypothetical protein [Parasitella parasitica]|uniref:Uncharacterized protein n=1 Tax=Parasitella parasitica TaxID=35722 RepID=A0A0B7N964_9FUNG|nr:hypothetical protein [Parasitella parasitica]
MQRLHPEQQNSSLGISKALQEEVRMMEDAENMPTNESKFFAWARFYISLYYNKLAVNCFGCLTGWKWYNRVDDYIILGALPTPTQIRKLHAQEKVDTIVNMCLEFPGYEKLYKDLGITQIRLETPDFSIPSTDLIHSGICEIVKRKEDKPKSTIYLHCKAGRGRSAAIAICYLLRTYDLNLTECQALLIGKRSQVDKDLVQSDEIRLYYKDLLLDIEAGRCTREQRPLD